MSLLPFDRGYHFNPQNNPKLVVLNGIQLPWDSLISLDAEKDITVSQILDGVAVFERILRKPTEINIDCSAAELHNMLEPTWFQSTFPTPLSQQGKNAEFVPLKVQLTNPPFLEFPQFQIQIMYQNMFQVNEVIKIQNTYLESLGISEVVVKKISFMPRLGSKVVNVRFQCLENYVGTNSLGTTLIIV